TALQYVTQGLKTLAVLAPAALSEELLFRGVPLVVLAKALGRVPAVVLMAIAFGIAHRLNPDVTAQGLANVALAGVFLGAAFYCPGGLWTAFAAHLGWNVTLALSGAAVSGVPFDVPVVDYQPGGPGWLTGGGFGPEGGLLATVALAAGTVAAASWARKDTS
ncbi:MAG: CPBP family intramembrane metalloprotease, partial [Gemmatimonadales bacterium]|nr:CPBP family intramembrane metalloprotease [Gemmatimonadales bacterium]